METDYQKYRGKCKEFSEQAMKDDPTLVLVRGHYIDPIWGKQQHWWCIKPDGTIVDLTAKQFPSAGCGEYIPFNGNIECETCGKEEKEELAYIIGSHAYCSSSCAAKDLL